MTKASGYLNITAVILTLGLAACTHMPHAQAADGEPPKTLVGTWQLVQFQPKDASAPAVKPASPDTYELTFLSRGRVAMKVDCNRATAIWEMTPSDGTHGSLSFGPLAMTRMACANPGLNTNWGLDANSVADYTVDGDTLSLGLRGGAGTYTWHRKPK